MNYLKIFPNCKIVLGYKNALINDLERNKTELLPLEFAQLLLDFDKKKSIPEIISK